MRNIVGKKQQPTCNKYICPPPVQAFFYTNLRYLLKYKVNKIVLLSSWNLPGKYKWTRNKGQTLSMVNKALHELVPETSLTSTHTILLFSMISSHTGLYSIPKTCSFWSSLIFHTCSLCLENCSLQPSHSICNLFTTHNLNSKVTSDGDSP